MRIFSAALLFLVTASSLSFAGIIGHQIDFQISQSPIVLPTSFEREQTCVAQDVSGPRVRFSAQLSWTGYGKLIPLIVSLEIKSENLEHNYRKTIGSYGHSSSLARFFNTTDSFLLPGVTYTSTDCFLDFGSLPAPKNILSGNDTLEVPGVVRLQGYILTPTGAEMPFEVAVDVKVNYLPGSVPTYSVLQIKK